MNFGDLFIDAGVVIAVITAVSAILTARINKNANQNYGDLLCRLEKQERLIEENAMISVRTDLYHALKTAPGETETIMAIAKLYFVDLKGDSYISKPMALWAHMYQVDISSLYRDTNDLRQQVAVYATGGERGRSGRKGGASAPPRPQTSLAGDAAEEAGSASEPPEAIGAALPAREQGGSAAVINRGAGSGRKEWGRRGISGDYRAPRGGAPTTARKRPATLHQNNSQIAITKRKEEK